MFLLKLDSGFRPGQVEELLKKHTHFLTMVGLAVLDSGQVGYVVHNEIQFVKKKV